MDCLGQRRVLRAQIFALLGLQALACDRSGSAADGAASKTTTTTTTTTGAQAPDSTTTEAQAPTPTTSTPEPDSSSSGETGEPEPAGETGETEDASAAAAKPEGADFCFAASAIAALALPDTGTDADSGCASRLDPGQVRTQVDSWGRRTGGPWDISVEFVASDRPDGGEQRCCYSQEFRRVPGTRPTRGRPLVVADVDGRERVVVPAVPARRASTGERGPADAWLRDAQVEHASVAAFARANLELMAVGGPAGLVRANLAAASEELIHAQMCRERAGVGALGPVELTPARGLDRVGLAARTLVEACIPETLGALAAARAAARLRAAGDPSTAALRERIAVDEVGHAALAWRTLAWVAQHEPGLGAELEPQLPELREVLAAVVDAEPELEPGELDALWAELIEPLYRALV